LKAAGLDRLNHNLNTSERHYKNICTTHAYADRLATLRAAKNNDLAVCSGVILGMGETPEDIFQMALVHRDIQTDSIPVNFLIPIPGIALKSVSGLTPEYCLRILCLFRFMNPRAEIRMAAGREMHLRTLEPLGLYVANSLFLQGYLNARGSSNVRTLQMIKDLGFTIKSEKNIDDLLAQENEGEPGDGIKGLNELRPFQKK
jgi:biotin synthase